MLSATPGRTSASQAAPTSTPRATPTSTPADTPAPATPVLSAPAHREPLGAEAPGAAAPSPYPSPAPTPTPPPLWRQNAGLAQALIGAVNDARVQRGLGAVSAHAALAASAQAYAQTLLERNPWELSHQVGGAPGDRARAAGYPGGYVGEVIATGSTSAQQMLEMWLSSPDHAGIILHEIFRDAGAGCYEGSYEGRSVTVCVVQLGAP